MPVEETVVLHIVCDNPNCPGNTLPVDDRTGWLFVNAEVYGEPTVAHVFCSPGCLSTTSAMAEFMPEPVAA